MFEVKVIKSFSSAHHLRNYDGKCENLHGHNWKVEAVYQSEKLDEAGLVIDFKVIKNIHNDKNILTSKFLKLCIIPLI